MAKRRAGWSIVFAAALILCIFTGGEAAARAFLLADVIIALLSGILMLAAGRKMNFEITGDESGKGRLKALSVRFPTAVFSCRIVLENVFTGSSNEVSAGFIPGYRRERICEFTYDCSCCGKYSLTADDPYITDFLGIFRRRLKGIAYWEFTVLPKCYPVNTVLCETTGPAEDDGLSEALSERDTGEQTGIREFRQGDSLKSIHWKLSQKTGKLLTREFGQPIKNELLIIFETAFAPDKDKLEITGILRERAVLMADLLRSVSYSLVCGGICHSIGWQDLLTGQYMETGISSVEEADNACISILGEFAGYGEQSATGRYLMSGRNEYSRVVIISDYLPDEAGILARRAQVTALIPEGENSVEIPFVRAVFISADAVKNGGITLEF